MVDTVKVTCKVCGNTQNETAAKDKFAWGCGVCSIVNETSKAGTRVHGLIGKANFARKGVLYNIRFP